MSIAIGSRLGEYEILARLGEGGMGEVYRARDHRLKREVAIKLLTGRLLADAGAARQLLEEARNAARLNHPHICTIHEVGESEGRSFIVMEYVEGRPLAAMIPEGGMPADAVARYGAQIADALAHAHERGIVHRDLKSANVAVSPDGRVKVLDFGIAASLEPAGVESTTDVSWAGGTPGTLACMAPEVLNGEPATRLSDIWALGVLLYEMTAGRLPFARKTAAATASAILHAPLPSLPPHVPATLRGIVQRCLARAPGERYQDAREIRAALEIVRETYGRAPESSADPAIAARPSFRRVWRAAIWLAAALGVIALGWWALSRSRSSEPALLVSAQRPVAGFGGAYRQATLSPDGGFTAFVDSGTPVSQIWVKNLAQGEPIQVTSGDVPAAHPAWSPRNDQIVFARRGQGLWSVPPLGGTARRLLEFGSNPRFSNDGERIVFDRGGREIWTARADGSEAKRVEGVPVPWYQLGLHPVFSPDAASIAYVMQEVGPNGDLWIVPSAGGTPRRLTFDLTEIHTPIWTPDGRFIVFSSMRGGSLTLWRVPPTGGAPEPVTVGAGEDIEPALSRDGRTLIYTNVRNTWRLPALNPVTGRERTIVERRRETLWPRFSRDGSKVAFFGYADEGDVQVFVTPTGGGAVQQVTRGKARINSMPRWSADGSLIYFYEQRPGASFRSVPMGGGAEQEIRAWQWESRTGAEFSPDGMHVAYYRQAAPGEAPVTERTIVHDVRSGTERALRLPLNMLRWSPDGRRVAGYIAGSPPVVASCPVDGGPCQRLTTGRYPVWSADGARVYFLRDTGNRAIKELWSMTPDGRDERKLFDRMGPYRAIDVMFDVSPSGEIVWNQFLEGRYELWQATLR